jgi:hypothetical protein
LSVAKSGNHGWLRRPGFRYAQSGLRELAPSAILRKQSRHRQSPPSAGIGSFAVSSAHQQAPERSQENSVPQAEQARRRGAEVSDRFVMNLNGSPHRFHVGFIGNGAMIARRRL